MQPAKKNSKMSNTAKVANTAKVSYLAPNASTGLGKVSHYPGKVSHIPASTFGVPDWRHSHFSHVGRAASMSELAEAMGGQELQTLAERHQNLRLGGDIPDSWLARYIFHPQFETFGGFVVLFNFGIMTMETHATATDDQDVLSFTKIMNTVLLFYYTLETCIRVYVVGFAFFRHGWNNLDVTIVATGWLTEVFAIAGLGGSNSMDQVSMLKSLRMLRLLRLVRLLVAFRELYVLVAGIGRCMKTLFWAAGLIFMVLNAWSILSVEFLDAKVKEINARGGYSTCSWCETAFSNIWYANLTWFQIISTTDWSIIGRPLVEHSFWTYLFFILNVFVVMWGLLNLIVAAIVDSNIAARGDDVAIAAKMAAQSQQQVWDSFATLCEKMDEDNSGDISVDEFKDFWKNNAELQHHLTIMGVREQDMDQLLEIMDEDGNGTLEHEEFIEQFTQMRTLVEKTTLYFLLKFVQNIQASLLQQSDRIQQVCKDLAEVRCSVTTSVPEIKREPSKTGSNSVSPTESHVKVTPPSDCLSSAGLPGSVAVPNTTPFATVLPPGWYYFGESLPLEAVSWCKDINPSGDPLPASMATSLPQSPPQVVVISQDSSKLTANAGLLPPGGSEWEPVPPPNCVPFPEDCVPLPRESRLQPLHPKDSMSHLQPPHLNCAHLGTSTSSPREGRQERHKESYNDLATKPIHPASRCDDDTVETTTVSFVGKHMRLLRPNDRFD